MTKLKTLRGTPVSNCISGSIQLELAEKLLKNSHLASLAYGGYPGRKGFACAFSGANRDNPEVACLS